MIRLASLAIAASLITAPIAAPAFAGSHTKGFMVKESTSDVPSTVSRLTAAIEKAGATVFAVVDHQANAKKAGLELEPTTLVIFGNPKIGTPIMQSQRLAGHDLPVRVLIWSEGGKTQIGALSPDTFKERYGVTADKPLTMMGGALGKLMGAAAGQ